jgi:putative protein-disulfide isomerase
VEKVKLVYFSDAICVWCYGFGPVVKRLLEKFPDQIDSIEVVNYGLCPGDRALVIDEIMAEYVEIEIAGVTKKTGAQFGKPFVDMVSKPGTRLDSQPAAEALEIVRRIDPARAFDFLHAVQCSINLEGAAPSDWQNLARQAEAVGIDRRQFGELVEAREEISQTVQSEYDKREEWGAGQAPTLFAVNNHGPVKIANGYIDYPKLEENFLKDCSS